MSRPSRPSLEGTSDQGAGPERLASQLGLEGEADAGTPAPKEPEHPGPFPVGRYANELRGFLRKRPRVRLIGEVTGLRITAKSVYFELRDGDGAMRCAIWRSDFDRMQLPEAAFKDGAEVVAAGGLDYYPGSATASPSFSFRASHIRLAGEGDLLAQLAALRRRLDAEGLFEPQKLLPRPVVPRVIGVITGGESAAKADVLAGLERRGWGGRVVFAHPPVQDRHAAPKITAALTQLAGLEQVELVIVARGGGSLADLWAFCDESLCRAVAMLRVPVISAVGHEIDRTLLDDVAAAYCSTPTHAVETAIPRDVAVERGRLAGVAVALERGAGSALAGRIRVLQGSVSSLGRYADAERRRLHQLIREVRAAMIRGRARRAERLARFGLVLSRRDRAIRTELPSELRRVAAAGARLNRAGSARVAERRSRLELLSGTLAAHDPDRVLGRGYALVSGADEGQVVSSAAEARGVGRLRVRFSDDHVEVEVSDERESS